MILLTVRIRTVCVKAKQNNAKWNNQTWLKGLLTIGEYLEEGELIVGGASVACIVSHHYPIVMVFGIMQNTVLADCWFFQVLPCIAPSVEFE